MTYSFNIGNRQIKGIEISAITKTIAPCNLSLRNVKIDKVKKFKRYFKKITQSTIHLKWSDNFMVLITNSSIYHDDEDGILLF